MAAAGIAGPQNVLEGPFGYFNLFEGEHDLAPVVESLGEVWRMPEVAHKPFPSGRATHGLVDAVLQLQREHGFAVADITSVQADVPPLTERLIGRPVKDDMAVGYARLCGQYAVASAMLTGGLGIADFVSAALAARDRLELAGRVTITADGNPDPNALSPITVRIMLRDGRTLSKSLTAIYGNPANPMTREAHLEKFRTNARAAARPLPEANIAATIAMIDDLEHQPSTVPLLALVHGEAA